MKKNLHSGWKETFYTLIEMQSQIDKLELEHDTEKVMVDKLLNEKVSLKGKINYSNEAVERILKDWKKKLKD